MAQTRSQRYPGSSRPHGTSRPGHSRRPLGQPRGVGRPVPKPLPPLPKPVGLPRIPLPAAALGRLLPLVGVALTLYELWRLLNEWNLVGGLQFYGYNNTLDCSKPKDFYNGVGGEVPPATCAINQAQQPNPEAIYLRPLYIGAWDDKGAHIFGPPFRNSDRSAIWKRQVAQAEAKVSPGLLPIPKIEPDEIPAIIPRFIPQADPWSAPSPAESFAPSPGYSPVPYEYVPYLPSVSPLGEPVRGPVPPARPKPQRNPFRGPIVRPIPTRKPGAVPRRAPTPWVRPRGPWDIPAPDPSEPGELPRPRNWPRPPPDVEIDTPPEATPEASEGGEPTNQGPPRTVNIPASRVEFPRYGPPRYSPRAFHRAVPPGKFTKERKGPVRYPFKFVNPATEACDVIKSVYKALPRKVRDLYGHKDASCAKFDEDGSRQVSDKTKEARKNKDRKRAARGRRAVDPRKREAAARRHEERREAFRKTLPQWLKPRDPCKPELTCQAQAGIIYREINKINPDVALRNIAKDQLVDLAIGVLSQGGRNLNEALGRPVGVGAGPAI